MTLAVPLILGGVALCAIVRRVDVFPALTRGAADGLRTVADIFPALLILFPAVYMLRASGALDAFAVFIEPLFSLLGIPPETASLALLRPISGSAATAAATDIIASCGADSLAGRTAAVMMGSSETTFYVIAVYFAAAGIKKTRWAIPAALCADLAAYIASAWISRLLWG
ncbi:MAG: spore maturation protein [Clostridia bacterium]|nr:spore maturation protein [Clostridia bacterium]